MAVAVTVWGVPRDGLPTIEPTSLYVLALLQLAQKQATVLTPPTLIHTEAVPALYTFDGHVGEVLATTPTDIRSYLHTGLDASAYAVHAALDDMLSDLVLHTLFSLPLNFQKVTCQALSQRTTIPSSLPRRMRAAVRARLESPHIRLWGMGGSWDREERREAQRWQTSAGLTEARDPLTSLPRQGFHSSLTSDMREEWERSRLATRARRVLSAVAKHASTHTATPVDARLYSLLAPLLYVEWPVDTLPALIRHEFPGLVEHTHRMHRLLWHDAPWAWERRPFHVMPASTPWWRTSKTPRSDATLPPTLRYGRLLWSALAILVPIPWLLLTGMIAIETVEDEDEPEEDEDVDEPEEVDAVGEDLDVGGDLDVGEDLDDGEDLDGEDLDEGS